MRCAINNRRTILYYMDIADVNIMYYDAVPMFPRYGSKHASRTNTERSRQTRRIQAGQNSSYRCTSCCRRCHYAYSRHADHRGAYCIAPASLCPLQMKWTPFVRAFTPLEVTLSNTECDFQSSESREGWDPFHLMELRCVESLNTSEVPFHLMYREPLYIRSSRCSIGATSTAMDPTVAPSSTQLQMNVDMKLTKF